MDIDLPTAAKLNRLPNLDSAYVGIIPETGSLFAMSPDRFPLVVFGGLGSDEKRGRYIDAAPESNRGVSVEDYLDVDMDDMKRPKINKERISAYSSDTCRNGSPDRRCLTGVRRLEAGSRSRFSRLLDAAAAPSDGRGGRPDKTEIEEGSLIRDSSSHASGATRKSITTTTTPWGWTWGTNSNTNSISRSSIQGMNTSLNLKTTTTSAVGSFALAIIFGLVWILVKMSAGGSKAAKVLQILADESECELAIDEKQPLKLLDDILSVDSSSPVTSANSISTAVTTPNTASLSPLRDALTSSKKSVKNADLPAEDGDDSDGDAVEADGETDVIVTAGKRKPRRGKRGRKKKAAIVTGGSEDVEEKEKDASMKTITQDEKAADHVQDVEIKDPGAGLATLVLPTPKPPSSSPSLSVSDTILG